MRAYQKMLSLALATMGAARPAISQPPTKVDVKADAEIGARLGRPSPDFKLKTITGTTVTLSELKGHPVVIYFWATWCPPCRAEMPLLVAAYKAHKDAGLEVLAVNLTDQEFEKDIRKFIAEFEMPFQVALDEKGRVRKLYGLIALPTFVFVGSDGIVRVVNSGPTNAQILARDVAEILAAQ